MRSFVHHKFHPKFLSPQSSSCTVYLNLPEGNDKKSKKKKALGMFNRTLTWEMKGKIQMTEKENKKKEHKSLLSTDLEYNYCLKN